MKRLILFLTVLCLSAGVASADYLTPPGWDDNPYFTHQGWSFDQAPGADEPANPDNNPYGVPTLNTELPWVDVSLIGQRQGGLLIQGPYFDIDPDTGQPTEKFAMEYYLPNEPNQRLFKDLWVEGVFVTNVLADPSGEFGGLSISTTVTDSNGKEFDWYWEPDMAPVGAGPMPPPFNFGWAVHQQAKAAGAEQVNDVLGLDSGEIEDYEVINPYPQPLWEKVVFEFGLLEGDPDNPWFVILDQIDFDTRCVPEPSTIAMLLGLGTMGLIALIRRRK